MSSRWRCGEGGCGKRWYEPEAYGEQQMEEDGRQAVKEGSVTQ